MDTAPSAARASALERARLHAPFLREAAAGLPAIVEEFLGRGAHRAIALALHRGEGEDIGVLLRRRRRALALAVALGDLSGELTLEEVTKALSDFADGAIDAALARAFRERVPDAPPAGLAVLALGKLGSMELNYSSDVDLILLFDPATLPRRARDEPPEAAVRIGRRLVELLQARTAEGYVQRVDLRLRPSAEITPIALSVDAAIAHYESSALPWERAAFIRARAAAGDVALGRRFLDEIAPFVWRRSVDFGAIDEIRQVSRRIRDHYAQGQAFGSGFDLKRGCGGIREVEFFTQVQQLVHGGRDPALRAPATLDAIAGLSAAGHLEPDVAARLAGAYRALRTAEHRVQMVEDQQTHRLPADPAGLDGVAALDGRAGGAALLAALRPHVEAVGTKFDELIGEHVEGLPRDPAGLRAVLTGLGFQDVDTPMRRISDWRSGRPRALRSAAALKAFEAMLPTLLAAIAAAGDPAHALNRLADVIERVSSGVNLFRLLEARPRLAQLMALVLSHAPPLAEQLARRPALLDGLVDDSSLAPPPTAARIAQRLTDSIGAAPLDRALEIARRTVNERRFAYGIQLIAGERDPLSIGHGYSDLAEGAIVALAQATSQDFASRHGHIEAAELVILALGRFGGRVLTNASDLDLIFLFDAPPGASSSGERPLTATDYYNRLASRIVASLSVPTAAGPLYNVDTRLRPEGDKGMLAVSLAGFEAYQREQAWTWERMALCRARPLFGSPRAKATVADLIRDLLRMPADPKCIRQDAAAMRRDMARHKPPAGALDIKMGEGGLVDLEFTVHTLQLIHGVGLVPDIGEALRLLAASGHIDAALHDDLDLLTRMLIVLRLVSAGSEPLPASRQLIAAVCDLPDWPALLDAQHAARQRIAAAWKEVKG